MTGLYWNNSPIDTSTGLTPIDAGTITDPSVPESSVTAGTSPIAIPISYGRRAILGYLLWTSTVRSAFDPSTGATGNFCDFAVAFGYSGTPSDVLYETDIIRLWAGNQVIYDRTNLNGLSLTTDVNFTIYPGSETQEPDDTIVAAEGTGTFPDIEGEASTTASLTSPMTVNLPVQIVNGEVLLAVVTRGGSGTQTFTWPAGWVELASSEIGPTGTARVAAAWKIADGSEGATMSVASTFATAAQTNVVVQRFSNALSVEVSSGSAFSLGSGVKPNPGKLIPSWGSDKTRWVAVAASTNSSAITSYPTNYAEGQVALTTGPTLAVASRTNEAESEDPGFFTFATTGQTTAFTIAVRPSNILAVPAFRNMIYAVFTDFNLSAFNLFALPPIRAELVDITEPVNYFQPFTEIGAIDEPEFFPAAVDWKRNYAFFVTDGGSNTTILRVFDLTNNIEIAQNTIQTASGVAVTGINWTFFWEVDEISGYILTSFGLNNTTPLILVNPLTGRVTAQGGGAAPNLANTGMDSTFGVVFPTRAVFFPRRTYWSGYIVACVGSLFNDLSLIGITMDGKTIKAIQTDVTLPATSTITGMVAGDGFGYTFDLFTTPPTPAQQLGQVIYVAAGRYLYAYAFQPRQVASIGGSFPWTLQKVNNGYESQNLVDDVGADTRIQLLFWDPARKAPTWGPGFGTSTGLCMFWIELDNTQHFRRLKMHIAAGYTGLTPNGSASIAIATVEVDVQDIPPLWNNYGFPLGRQYSRCAIGRMGYTTADGFTIIHTQHGNFHVYPFAHLVLLADAEVSDSPTEYTLVVEDNYIYDGNSNTIILKPHTSLSPAPVGRMYLNGILSRAGVNLSDLLQWIGIQAGYDPNNVIVYGITDKIIGAIISEQTSVWDLITNLASVYQFDYYESEGKIKFVHQPKDGTATIQYVIPSTDLAPIAGGDVVAGLPAVNLKVGAPATMPDGVQLSYIDFTADYVQNTQIVKRTQFPFNSSVQSNNILSYSVPIVMTATDALEHATKILYGTIAGRMSQEGRLPPKYIRLEPSDLVTLNVNDVEYTIKMNEVTINADYSVNFNGATFSTQFVVDISAGDPLQLPQTVRGASQSMLVFIDAPLLNWDDLTSQADTFAVYVNAAPVGFGSWRGAQVFEMTQLGVTAPIGGVNNAGVMGAITNVLPPGVDGTMNADQYIDVVLQSGVSTTLVTATDTELSNNVNLAYIGDTGRWELIQFQTVTDNGNGNVTLTGLIRGLRNTEAMVDLHEAGDRFVLLTSGHPIMARVSRLALDTLVDFTAVGFGTSTPSGPFIWQANTNAKKPWSPTDFLATDSSGDAVITWERRSPIDTILMDGTDVPLLEQATEAYEIDLYDGDGETILQTYTGIASPTYTISAADIDTVDTHEPTPAIIVNPGCETLPASTGWTVSGGGLSNWETDVHSGSHSFYGIAGSGAVLVSYQDIAVPTVDMETAIDATGCRFKVNWWQKSRAGDLAGVGVEFYDSGMGLLVSHPAVEDVGSLTEFVERSVRYDIPALTRFARVIMQQHDVDGSLLIHCFVDDIYPEWQTPLPTTTLTLAIYQIADDTDIGRGFGVKRSVPIIY